MIKEKEEEEARPSKINGSINKACCWACGRASPHLSHWCARARACVGGYVHAWGGGVGMCGGVGEGGAPRQSRSDSSKCTAARGNQSAHLNLFRDVCGVWSTLLGLLLLNTSCLLQSVWSRLHYWYNKEGGPEGPRLRWCAGLLSFPECVWRESAATACERSEVS